MAVAPNSTHGDRAVYRGDGLRLYGLDAEVELRLQAKQDPQLEKDIAEWISGVVGEKLNPPDNLQLALKSGIVLCKLINIIQPGSIKVINTKPIALMEMENIGYYLKACWKLGVPSGELFVTSDLYLNKAFHAVVQNILSLARLVQNRSTWTGPKISAVATKPLDPVTLASLLDENRPAAVPKSWKKIENKGPRYVTDDEAQGGGGPQEVTFGEMKSKYENEFRLRVNLQAELEDLRAKTGNRPATGARSSNSGTPATTPSQKEKDLQKELDDIKKELGTLKQTQQTASSNREKELNKEIEDLKQQLYKLKTASPTSQRERSSTVSSTPSQKEKDLQKELEELKKELNKAKSTTPAPASTSLQKELEDLKKELGRARSATTTTQPSSLKEKEMQKELDQLKKDLEKARSQPQASSTLTAEREKQLLNEIEQLRQEVNKARTDRSDIVSPREQQYEKEIKELKRELKAKTDAEKRATRVVTGSSPTISSTSNSEADKLKQRVEKLEEENRKARSDKLSLEQELVHLREELHKERDSKGLLIEEIQQVRKMSRQTLLSAPSSPSPSPSALSPTTPRSARTRTKTLKQSLSVDVALNEDILMFLEECVNNILFSRPIEFHEVTKLNELFKTDHGRRSFTQILKTTMKEVPSLVLSENSFELLLYLFNTVLQNQDLSDQKDLISAKILMYSASALSRKSLDGESFDYIKDYIQGYDIWKNPLFWEEYFWAELSQQYREMVSSDEDSEWFTKFFVPDLILLFSYNMAMNWRLPITSIRSFVSNVTEKNGVADKQLTELQEDVNLIEKCYNNPERKKDLEARLKKREQAHQKKEKTLKKTGASSKILGGSGGHEHQWRPATLSSPTWCQACSKFIWGLQNQGSQCRICAMTVHKKCVVPK